MSLLNRLLGRAELPAGFTGRLDADEHVLAAATTGDDAPVVVTSLGLWWPDPDGTQRRIGWHLINKASWQQGGITLIEAEQVDVVDGALLITDRPPRRLRLVEPGRVPETVHARVEGSIKSRHHRELPGGGAWFVQRKVPGRDGVQLQVRPDPGTDEQALRRVAGQVATMIGQPPR
jgi:hypothetical protein